MFAVETAEPAFTVGGCYDTVAGCGIDVGQGAFLGLGHRREGSMPITLVTVAVSIQNFEIYQLSYL